MRNTYSLTKVTKDLKSKYKSLKGKETHTICWRIDSNFEKVLPWVKCYQTALRATEKLLMKQSDNQWGKLHCCLKKLPQPPQPSATSTPISQQPSTSPQDPRPAKRL